MISFGFLENPTSWLDYPGLELWKFFNLAIFVGGMLYILKRPLTDAFRSRRETIRRELLEAQRERDEAQAKLAELRARLSGLDAEVASIQEQARMQAEAERQRIVRETESEMARLREQAQREIETAGKIARQELRRFAAQQSVAFAESLVRSQIRVEDDARLIQMNVERLGEGRN